MYISVGNQDSLSESETKGIWVATKKNKVVQNQFGCMH